MHIYIGTITMHAMCDDSVRLRAMQARCACAPFQSVYIWYAMCDDMVRVRAMLGALERLVFLFDGTMLAHMCRSVAAILS